MPVAVASFSSSILPSDFFGHCCWPHHWHCPQSLAHWAFVVAAAAAAAAAVAAVAGARAALASAQTYLHHVHSQHQQRLVLWALANHWPSDRVPYCGHTWHCGGLLPWPAIAALAKERRPAANKWSGGTLPWCSYKRLYEFLTHSRPLSQRR